MEEILCAPLTSKETALILDFSVQFGREVMMRGGELWRAEELMNRIFEAYQMKNVSIYIDLHALFVSASREGEEPMTRQITVGDISPDLEKLTRLNRLMRRICDEGERPAPETLEGLLEEALEGEDYPPFMFIVGTVCALLSLSYIMDGTVHDAIIAAVSITLFMLIDRFFDVPGTNHIVLRSGSALAVGLLICQAFKLGFLTEPYMAIIIVAFGLMPGIPLINACREIFCGRVLNGISLLAYAFTETAIIVAGFFLALTLMGVLA